MGENVTWYSAYLGNLPPGVTQAEVGEWLKYFEPLSVFVHPPLASCTYTYGFARFDCKEQRNCAVTSMNGSMLGGKKVTVEVAAPPTGRSHTANGKLPQNAAAERTVHLQMTQGPPSPSCRTQQQQASWADVQGDRDKLQFLLQCYRDMNDQKQLQEQQLSPEGRQQQMAAAAGATSPQITEEALLMLILQTPYGLCSVTDDLPTPRNCFVNTEKIRQRLPQILGTFRDSIQGNPSKEWCEPDLHVEEKAPEPSCDVPSTHRKQQPFCQPTAVTAVAGRGRPMALKNLTEVAVTGGRGKSPRSLV